MKQLIGIAAIAAIFTGISSQSFAQEASQPSQMVTIKAAGSNPGVGFSYLGAKRVSDLVVVSFEYPSQSSRDIENIWIRNYDNNASTVTGINGEQYQITSITLGESTSSEGVSQNLPAGGKLAGSITISGIPADQNRIGRIDLRSTGQYPMDATLYNYTFIIENSPIMQPKAARQTTTGSGSRSAVGADGKVKATTGGGIFQGATTVRMPEGGWSITPKTVGPLELGMNVKAMPGRVEGLYNKVKTWDANSTTLYLDDNECMNLNIVNDRIAGISVISKVAHVKIGNKTFSVGGDSDLLKVMPGVRSESYNDNADYEGIHFEGHDSEIQTITIGKY